MTFFIRESAQAWQQRHIIGQRESIGDSYKLIYVGIVRHALLVRSPMTSSRCFRRDKVILCL